MKTWRREYCIRTIRSITLLVIAFLILQLEAGAQCHVAVQTTHTEISCLESEAQIVWTDMSNTAFDGNLLSKTGGGNSWNAGTASVTSIGYGGSIYLVVQSNNTERNFGLSLLNTGTDQNSIRHAFHLRDNGGLRIREFSSNRGDFGNYNIGDTLRIEHNQEGARYYRNSDLLYVSQLATVSTLIADVSLRNTAATLGSITLVNPTDGEFSFDTEGEGTGSTYEWFLNGITTGISDTDLNLTSLQDGDVVTCLLTPGTGSCFSGDTLSTTYTLRNRSNPEPFEFYITSTSSDEGCIEFREEVVWDQSELLNLEVEGSALTKFDGGSSWNGGAFSLNAINDNGYFEFIATETNLRRIVGISNSNINSNWNTIDYAFYLENNGDLSIRENGANRGDVGTYNTGDTLRISIENGVVHYYRNREILRVGGAATTLMYVDVSIRDEQGSIGEAHIVNLGEGTITAVAENSGTTPTYQWRRNGSPVGTSNNVYDGPAIEDGDVLSCDITPDANTCTPIVYSSNQIVSYFIQEPASSNFFISGDITGVACQQISEEVVWDISSIQNAQFENGVLTKVQGGSQWNAGASSLNRVGEGGYMEVIASESSRRRMIGLSDVDVNTNFNTIDFAFYLTQNGNLIIYEGGSNRGTFGTYSTNDTLRISVENSTVYYSRNSETIRIAPATPNLPLLVDVSMRDVNSTLSKVSVTNYSEGNFTAVAENAGLNPTFQWRLNGSPVGSNSSTYNNTSIVDGDQITCELTPDLGGCSSISYVSNLIEVSEVSEPTDINFFISGDIVTASCQQVSEEVVWDANSLENVEATGNTLEKVQGNGQWTGGAASLNQVGNEGYLEFIATETNRRRMIGLSDTDINSNFNTIDYAFYLQNNTNLTIYENGSNRGTFGTYSTGDTLRIAVENSTIHYYKNGEVVRIAPAAPTLPLIVDVSIRDTGGTLSNVSVTNNNDGNFTAFASNAGTSPNYQWRLNGAPVGTNSTSYSNPLFTDGDVITCELIPDLGGCGSTTYNSNAIEGVTIPDPPAISFYIASERVTDACQEAKEEVVWNLNSLENVDASGNSLLKVQGNGQWNGGASSINTVVNNGSFEFIASETNRRRMIGLSDVDVNSNFNTIDFAYFLLSNGQLRIYESGANRGTFGNYSTGDTLRIEVENNAIYYYRNQDLLRVATNTPNLPLIVDVSIRDVNGTITGATVTNPNGGNYTASVLNAGSSPSYQWFLNGTPVGTDSPNYSNSGVVSGDVITCELSPDLGGCSSTIYTSNTITLLEEPSVQTVSPIASNVSTASGYAFAEEDLVWDPNSLENVDANENNIVKFQSNNAWNGGAASTNRVYTNGYLEFSTNENNERKMVGLSTDNTNSNFNTIDFAFYMEGNGNLRIYESGANRGNFGTYQAGDLFRIGYQNGAIEYYRNGVLLRTVTGGAASYLVDVSIRDIGGTVVDAIAGNLTDGDFTVLADDAGTNPDYQWQLNGSNVGTGSTSYSNTNLVDGDILTC
ncbi:MAG: hypothetical protein AAGC47_03855, partial [Bacteroidota bacterium]